MTSVSGENIEKTRGNSFRQGISTYISNMSSIPHHIPMSSLSSSANVGVNTNFGSSVSVGVGSSSSNSNHFRTIKSECMDFDDKSNLFSMVGNSTPVEHVKSSSRVFNATPKAPVNVFSPSFLESDHLIPKAKLLQLVRDVDANLQLDDDVEETLLQRGDDMFEEIMSGALRFARHRNSNTIELKDVQIFLDKMSHLWMPGHGNQEARSLKKMPTADAHKQRLQLIKKSIKKY